MNKHLRLLAPLFALFTCAANAQTTKVNSVLDMNEFIQDWKISKQCTSCLRQGAAIYHLDLKTQQISKLPNSDGLFAPRLSRDGRYLTALPADRNTVMLYDLQTERWSVLVQNYGSIAWSHDSKSVYLIRRREAQVAELVRISIPDGKTERVLDLKDVTLGSFWDWVSLLPDDSALLMLDKSTQEIYRLDLQYR